MGSIGLRSLPGSLHSNSRLSLGLSQQQPTHGRECLGILVHGFPTDMILRRRFEAGLKLLCLRMRRCQHIMHARPGVSNESVRDTKATFEKRSSNSTSALASAKHIFALFALRDGSHCRKQWASTARRLQASLDSPWLLALFPIAVVIGDPFTTAIFALLPSMSMLADLDAAGICRRTLSLMHWAAERRARAMHQAQACMFTGQRRVIAKFRTAALSRWLAVLGCFCMLSLFTIGYQRAASQLCPGRASFAGRVVVEMLRIVLQPLDSLLL